MLILSTKLSGTRGEGGHRTWWQATFFWFFVLFWRSIVVTMNSDLASPQRHVPESRENFRRNLRVAKEADWVKILLVARGNGKAYRGRMRGQ